MLILINCLTGKKIDPKHATPKNRGRSNRTKKIFVGGVSQDTNVDEVKAYFSQYGKVCSDWVKFGLPSVPIFNPQ